MKKVGGLETQYVKLAMMRVSYYRLEEPKLSSVADHLRFGLRKTDISETHGDCHAAYSANEET